VQHFLELWTVLADHPRDLSASANLHVRVRGEAGEDLLPEIGEVVLDDRDLHEASVTPELDSVLARIAGATAPRSGREPGHGCGHAAAPAPTAPTPDRAGPRRSLLRRLVPPAGMEGSR